MPDQNIDALATNHNTRNIPPIVAVKNKLALSLNNRMLKTDNYIGMGALVYMTMCSFEGTKSLVPFPIPDILSMNYFRHAEQRLALF